jgi:hypothetical protein
LPAGPLELGALYDAFPYDNRLVTLDVTGADLRAALLEDVRRGRRGALAVSGVRVVVRCTADGPDVALYWPSGEPIAAGARLVVAAMDSVAYGPILGAARRAAAGGVAAPDAPLLRVAVERWLRGRGGRLDAREFASAERPRWDYSALEPTGDCGAEPPSR